MEKTIKLLLSYHKPDHLFKDSVLTPVHAGRANAKKRMSPDDDKLKWLFANMPGDDTGDNISELNGIYNEMTTVYWAWKNYDAIGNPDYIGFMHYRRHFVFDTNMPQSSYECMDIGEDYYDRIKYNEASMAHVMDDCDFVCVKPQWRVSMYEHFRLNHEIQDLDTTVEILKEKYPDYADAADTYLSGHTAYFCNMFIFPKDMFFRYAEWFFDITAELLRRIDFTNKRLFVSEWLTGIFITHMLEQGLKAKTFPMMIAEGEHEIPVVLAADNGYAYPMAATVQSILQTARQNTTYVFYLLVSGDFSDENKCFIDKICRQNKKCRYSFLDMQDQYDCADVHISHITKATYYRLRLPSLLPDVGKCIYLDTDTIVKSDLSELYRTCLDDKYIAGVRALGYFENNKKINDKAEELGIPSMEEYVNAGVLLMNLAKMRRDNLEARFEELLDRNFESQDQDILNSSCYGRIRRLHFKFNSMTKYPLYSDSAYDNTPHFQRYISRDEWDFGRRNPVVIHYADRKKPWNDLSSHYAWDWWDAVSHMPLDVHAKIFDCYLATLVDNAYTCEHNRVLTASHKHDALNKVNELNRRLEEVESERNFYRGRNHEVENCTTFKTGKVILFIPKKIKGGFKCIKDHGFGYTVKLFFKKCKFTK